MKYRLLLIPVLLCLLSILHAQEVPPWTNQTPVAPKIILNDHAVELQQSLYPNIYRGLPATDDLAWVALNDTSIVNFLQINGDSIMLALSRLSGIEWRENSIELFLLRYYPTPGSSQPMILPVGGIRVGSLSEAIPSGAITRLALLYQLAERMLLQGLDPGSSAYPVMSRHQLMVPGAYRRDNLAFLLALSVGRQILGPDSLYQAYESGFWKRYLVGREILEQYLYPDWTLTPEHPLTRWLADEPPDSKLMQVTDPAADQIAQPSKTHRAAIEGISPTGQLGFALRLGSGALMIVDKIDTTRAAYRGGLREGDIIRTVDGQRPRNQKELVQMVLDRLETGGALLQVTRNDKTEAVFIRPMATRGR